MQVYLARLPLKNNCAQDVQLEHYANRIFKWFLIIFLHLVFDFFLKASCSKWISTAKWPILLEYFGYYLFQLVACKLSSFSWEVASSQYQIVHLWWMVEICFSSNISLGDSYSKSCPITTLMLTNDNSIVQHSKFHTTHKQIPIYILF